MEHHSFVDNDPPSMSSWIFYIRPSQTKLDIRYVCRTLKKISYFKYIYLGPHSFYVSC